MDRNPKRSEALKTELKELFPSADIRLIGVDLSDIESVKSATERLKELEPDVFIHNAGAYSIPRYVCETGLDNVFQINFASPYYMIKELMPALAKKGGRVVAVGSIAHAYSKSDPDDIDFKTRKKASLVYGNAKRYLMFSLSELFSRQREVKLCITHPGISFTNITAHYPKLIFAIIKYPMKIIFMKPKKASLSILRGVFEASESGEWIGPRFFNVWGLPKKKKIRKFPEEEVKAIFERSEKIYRELC